jgi:hypothetical protein
LLVLLAAMTLSVFKPWGMTPYGRRRASKAYSPSDLIDKTMPVREPVFMTSKPRWTRIIGIHIAHAVILVLLFAVILHITGIYHH